MDLPMKALFTGERAMRFLRDTVVGGCEGALFVVVAVLFKAAGVTSFFESNRLAVDAAEIAAANAPVYASTPAAAVATADTQPAIQHDEAARDSAAPSALIASLP